MNIYPTKSTVAALALGTTFMLFSATLVALGSMDRPAGTTMAPRPVHVATAIAPGLRHL